MKEKIMLTVARGTLDMHGSRQFFVTSPDVPGLLVAERTFEEALAAVPQALRDLEEAATQAAVTK